MARNKGKAVIAIRYTCPECEANLTLLINKAEHCPGCERFYLATGDIRVFPKVVNIKVGEITNDPFTAGMDAVRLEDIKFPDESS